MGKYYETKADANDYLLIFPFTSSSVGAHFHKSLEFVYCIEGSMEFFVNGTKFILNADEIYAVPSYYVHYNRTVGNNKILSLVFAHNYFHDFEKSYPNQTFDFVLKNHEKNRDIYHHFSDFYDLFVAHNWNYNKIPFLKRQAVINELLYDLANAYPLKSLENKKINNTLLDILTYINEHYTENITLHQLAAQYGYSPKYFSEIFNKNVGCNLTTYINNIRIENAIKQMEDPNNKKPLTSIAFDHGFNSLATFYRALQKKKGN